MILPCNCVRQSGFRAIMRNVQEGQKQAVYASETAAQNEQPTGVTCSYPGRNNESSAGLSTEPDSWRSPGPGFSSWAVRTAPKFCDRMLPYSVFQPPSDSITSKNACIISNTGWRCKRKCRWRAQVIVISVVMARLGSRKTREVHVSTVRAIVIGDRFTGRKPFAGVFSGVINVVCRIPGRSRDCEPHTHGRVIVRFSFDASAGDDYTVGVCSHGVVRASRRRYAAGDTVIPWNPGNECISVSGRDNL